jgi:hypothetical protein
MIFISALAVGILHGISSCILAYSFIKGYDIRFKVIWYDFWIGIYFDDPNKRIYLNYMPCFVIIITKQ